MGSDVRNPVVAARSADGGLPSGEPIQGTESVNTPIPRGPSAVRGTCWIDRALGRLPDVG